MGFRTIVVSTHSKLSYKNNHLVFTSADRKEVIHLSEIDSVILQTTDITITSMLIKRLIDEKILILFCDEKALPQSMVLDLYGRYDNSIQIRKQIQWPEETKAQVGMKLIAQKIENQAMHLHKLNFLEKSDHLLEMETELSIDDPRNVEAHVARIYFNHLFGNQFTRKDDSDINAGLNYGYSLLLATFSREIVTNGCLTQLGLVHSNQFNKNNFASDIMEPFRPIIDEIVYEHKDEKFYNLKRKLLDIFDKNFLYNDQNMYLTNIAADYTRKIIKILNGENEEFPVFRI